jgi:hypothetical protein
VRVLERYSLRAAVFQKVGLKIMKAAAAVGGGKKKVVSFCDVGFFGSACGLGGVSFRVCSAATTRTHAFMKTYPISWVG